MRLLSSTFVALTALLIGGLSLRALRQERGDAEQQLSALLLRTLGDARARVAAEVTAAERELEAALGQDASADDLRALARHAPLVRQAFLVAPSGGLAFPAGPTMSDEERMFVSRTDTIWSGRGVLFEPSDREGQERAVAKGRGDTLARLAARASSGWLRWYFDDGMQLLYWKRRGDGRVAGAWVETAALDARLVVALALDNLEGAAVVRDGRGRLLHQAGRSAPPEGALPFRSLALAEPLDAWRLEYYPSAREQAAFLSPGLRTTDALVVLATVILLGALALRLARAHREALRDAEQRVSFVTQVSHELRTPLTNIRLYAELLGERGLDDEASRDAAVIAQESQRLSRLIDNVLSFSRPRAPRLESVVVDEMVRDLAEQFRAGLAQRGMSLELVLQAPLAVTSDRDALAQIVGNLLSNAEKYALGGGWVGVETAQAGARTTVTVKDRGPGIAPGERDAIFRPYYRSSNAVTDGVTGTGIGLTIARELARALGGTLEAAPSERGACFVLSLERLA